MGAEQAHVGTEAGVRPVAPAVSPAAPAGVGLLRQAGNAALAKLLQREEQWNDRTGTSSFTLQTPDGITQQSKGTRGDGATYTDTTSIDGDSISFGSEETYPDGYKKRATSETAMGSGSRQETSEWTGPDGRPALDMGPGGAPVGSYADARNQLQAMRALSFASKGPLVVQLQERLAAHGHAVAADGEYGPSTVDAVKAFQAERGLEADGVCGPATWAAAGGEGQLPTIREQQRAGRYDKAQEYTAVNQYIGSGLVSTMSVRTAADGTKTKTAQSSYGASSGSSMEVDFPDGSGIDSENVTTPAGNEGRYATHGADGSGVEQRWGPDGFQVTPTSGGQPGG